MMECRQVFRGVATQVLLDETRAIDLEGAFRSGKTTVALWKVLKSCLDHPGIAWLICRYSDGDTQTKLKPPWREMLRRAGIVPQWDPAALCDLLPNGSRVYIFGLKAQDQVSRYSKLRGITLAGIYCDQAEELPYDVYQEFAGRLSQNGMPHQLLLTPNPPSEDHWLAEVFPEDQHVAGHRYYSVPIYANAENLDPETIRELEAVYQPSHAKHRSAVLGLRGLNVIGKPVYADSFRRALHVRPLTYNPDLPLCESIDFGKHHPCVVWGQFGFGGALLLGGLLGQDLFLEDFAPLVKQYRAQWFPDRLEVQTTCDPAGSHNNSQGVRWNGITVLREHDIHAVYKDDANAPDVRAAMIERWASYMRKRRPGGQEAFGVCANDPADPRWVRVSARGLTPMAFLADAFEAGYVWDQHMVSVGSKQIRKPVKDGWYEHGMNCCEYLELAFGGAQRSVTDIAQHAARRARAEVRRAQRDDGDRYRWGQQQERGSRGGT